MSGNTMKSIVVFYSGYKFGFTRDDNDNGFWYCLSPGRSQFGSVKGCMVPKQYWTEISRAAIEQGIDVSLLRYSPAPKESQNKTIKIYSGEASSTKKKNDGGINIF
jgi:hypothetical protein